MTSPSLGRRDGDRAQALELLRRADALLEESSRARMERATSADQAEIREHLEQTMLRLELALEREPAEADRLARKAQAVRGRYALHARRMPEGRLDGLYEAVRAEASGERGWMRAGMSGAFLDAPRNLVIWRRTAMAACLLLAVGAGMMLTEQRGFEAPGAGGMRAGFDPRDELLSLRVLREPEIQRSTGEIVPASGGASARQQRRLPRRQGVPRIWSVSTGRALGARRMLDSVQIFPVPSRRAVGDVEQN